MHKIFVDSDILLDVFANREPFYTHAAKLLTLVERKKINGFTTPLVFANIHYVLRKLKSKEYAMQSLRKLRIILDVLQIDQKHIDQALNSEFSDFEDAIQYYSAKSKNVNCIITRNKKDYKHSTIAVYDAEEYLSIFAANARI